MGWIGVDLDGTLAQYDKWRGHEHIGSPIPAMVDRVKNWLSIGKDVKIFTARVSNGQAIDAVDPIDRWCLKVFGRTLDITCEKDMKCVEIWDDRAVTVEQNTGRVLTR